MNLLGEGLCDQDARVRIFHGDELVLAITPEGEELGFAPSSAVKLRQVPSAKVQNKTSNGVVRRHTRLDFATTDSQVVNLFEHTT